MTRPTHPEPFSERFDGYEFDWFAQDAEGNLALFSTGGFAPVPRDVQVHYQAHDRAASSIELPHGGSATVWKDYARQGLYVFDWVANTGLYQQLEQPEGVMPDAVQQLLLQITDLPQFTGVFRLVTSIAVGEDDEMTPA